MLSEVCVHLNLFPGPSHYAGQRRDSHDTQLSPQYVVQV